LVIIRTSLTVVQGGCRVVECHPHCTLLTTVIDFEKE